uniref:Uncharacterized protein n=1 Tax=Arundo donax TaxID=35708 RepID=A0A0A8Y6C5_ARUDO
MFPTIEGLVDVFHHDAFHFRDLSFHFGQPAHLLWVIHTVLHLISKPWPEISAETVGCSSGCFAPCISLVEILLYHF